MLRAPPPEKKGVREGVREKGVREWGSEREGGSERE